jgi:4-diphosphocytidyl-2-C-methyl-D-erythritol kinase
VTAGARTARLRSPAKLTVSLRVEGVRPDGYHELTAEMVALDLHDRIEIDPDGDGLAIDQIAGRAAEIGADNLVTRALRAVDRQARVVVHKRIPVGGGLGGGSSNAATVLRWAGVDDLEIAAHLGADVPFCLRGGRALVRGIGERVEALPFEDRTYVLLLPPFGVDTGAAYRAYDQGERPAVSWAASARHGNDLEEAALSVEPRLAAWRDAFAEQCTSVPRLAGSGSTWFVEGSFDELGLGTARSITVDGEEGELLEVHTVPPGWEWDPDEPGDP